MIHTFGPDEFGLTELENIIVNDRRILTGKGWTYAGTFVEGNTRKPLQCVVKSFDADSGENAVWVYVDTETSTDYDAVGNLIRNSDLIVCIHPKDLGNYTWDDETLTLTHTI